jgi:hypothetical protein
MGPGSPKPEFGARSKQTDAFSKSHFPEGAQLEVQHRGCRDDGRLHDLSELRGLEVRIVN